MTEEKNDLNLPGPMDYERLRDYGLAHIREIGHRYWTDFNVHDPGVTILEALTLALNDLSYRSSAAMADLLTRPGGIAPSLEGTMFPPELILPNAPTTPDDYRKLVLENVSGVRNVWFIPVEPTVAIPYIPNKTTTDSIRLRGCYNVLVELEDSVTYVKDLGAITQKGPNLDQRTMILREIENLLLRHRNLCEQFRDISFLEPVEVGLCAEIEIDSDVDVRSLLQEIYDRMYDYVCPTLQFHTVEELLASGRDADEIFSVQTPKLGFIDSEELRTFSRKTHLYASDAIGILMGIKGIKSIRHIHFIAKDTPSGSRVRAEYEGRHLFIDEYENLTFSLSPCFHRNYWMSGSTFVNNIVFQRSGLTFFPPDGPDGISVRRRMNVRPPLGEGTFHTSLPLPEGTYLGTDRYFSFQNLLPAAYRMGDDTLPDTASGLRKAERLQLKAYLTFFDQVLADYLAQLDHFLDLLSIEDSENTTYFHLRLRDTDIVDVSKVLDRYPDYPLPAVDEDTDLARKNAILNHLLSRFSDSFAEYTALEFVKKGYEDQFTLRECVEDKKRFLRDYPNISSRRSIGVDWTVPPLPAGSAERPLQVTGAERRILRKLGVNDPDARGRLSEGNALGIYLLEHSLLVPQSPDEAFLRLEYGDTVSRYLDDPYSFRVTAVLPGWAELTGNLHYRKYVETIIREELPAHLFVKICWVSRDVMRRLEDAYDSWHRVMYEGTQSLRPMDWKTRRKMAVNGMVEAIEQFANIYQAAVVMPDDTVDYINDDSLTRLDFAFLGEETDAAVSTGSGTPTSSETGREDVADILKRIRDAGPTTVGNIVNGIRAAGPITVGNIVKGIEDAGSATDGDPVKGIGGRVDFEKR